jgi:UDP:flavonoid glycosyltransferase YjiC (YdhE family)
MKVALAGYGSRGDVEPLAAVGRELLRRGHDVSMAVPPNMLEFVESAGLSAVAFGSEPPQPGGKGFAPNNGMQDPASLMAEVVGHITQAWADWGTALTELADGADLLLTGKVEQGLAANVAEYYGIPLATLQYFPEGDSPLGGLLGHVTQESQDAQRRALGLPRATGLSMRPELEIQAYDEVCFPGLAAEWSQQGGLSRIRPFVGGLTLELPTAADDEVLSWIAAGAPPIYFGFGSMPIPSPAETVAVISAACTQLGERALMCSGPNNFSRCPHFDNVRVVDGVNHSAVFPACRAVVHHGGCGTAAAAMRAAVPTLILWHQVDDQAIWAAAVTELKVGSARAFSASTLDSLVADLRFVLAPECVTRAREVAAELTEPAKSVARTADLLEETVRLGRNNFAHGIDR